LEYRVVLRLYLEIGEEIDLRRCTTCGSTYEDDVDVCPRDGTPLFATDAQVYDDSVDDISSAEAAAGGILGGDESDGLSEVSDIEEQEAATVEAEAEEVAAAMSDGDSEAADESSEEEPEKADEESAEEEGASTVYGAPAIQPEELEEPAEEEKDDTARTAFGMPAISIDDEEESEEEVAEEEVAEEEDVAAEEEVAEEEVAEEEGRAW